MTLGELDEVRVDVKRPVVQEAGDWCCLFRIRRYPAIAVCNHQNVCVMPDHCGVVTSV